MSVWKKTLSSCGAGSDLPALGMYDGVQSAEGCFLLRMNYILSFQLGLVCFRPCFLSTSVRSDVRADLCRSCHFCSCVDRPTSKTRFGPSFLTGTGATARTNSILTSRVERNRVCSIRRCGSSRCSQGTKELCRVRVPAIPES